MDRRPAGPYNLDMTDSRPTDELGTLRFDVARMESGAMTLRRSRRVTQREIGILKREIAILEKVEARSKEART
jgi:hypothetical protein